MFLERSVSTCRAMEQIIIYWHNPGVNLLFCTWSCLRAALAALIWSRFCARTALLLSPKACSCSQLVFRKQTISACHRHTTDHCQSSLESAQTCHDVMAGFIMRARAFTSTTGQSTSRSALFGFVTNQTNRKYRY